MVVTTHVCRGNFRSTWISEGGYEPVAETMLGKLNYDGYFLEYDSERAGGFAPLRFLPKGNKIVVLGLVTTKSGTLEKKDDIKRRIDEATKYAASISSACRRNAASPPPKRATCSPRRSNGRSSAWWWSWPTRYWADAPVSPAAAPSALGPWLRLTWSARRSPSSAAVRSGLRLRLFLDFHGVVRSSSTPTTPPAGIPRAARKALAPWSCSGGSALPSRSGRLDCRPIIRRCRLFHTVRRRGAWLGCACRPPARRCSGLPTRQIPTECPSPFIAPIRCMSNDFCSNRQSRVPTSRCVSAGRSNASRNSRPRPADGGARRRDAELARRISGRLRRRAAARCGAVGIRFSGEAGLERRIFERPHVVDSLSRRLSCTKNLRRSLRWRYWRRSGYPIRVDFSEWPRIPVSNSGPAARPDRPMTLRVAMRCAAVPAPTSPWKILRTDHGPPAWRWSPSVAATGSFFGDAVHLFTPTSGLGMNTASTMFKILAWKLAAVLQLGGGAFLASYEAQRLRIALRRYRARHGGSPQISAQPMPPGDRAATVPAGEAARRTAGDMLAQFAERFASIGVQLGARYDGHRSSAKTVPLRPTILIVTGRRASPAAARLSLWLDPRTQSVAIRLRPARPALRCSPRTAPARCRVDVSTPPHA